VPWFALVAHQAGVLQVLGRMPMMSARTIAACRLKPSTAIVREPQLAEWGAQDTALDRCRQESSSPASR